MLFIYFKDRKIGRERVSCGGFEKYSDSILKVELPQYFLDCEWKRVRDGSMFLDWVIGRMATSFLRAERQWKGEVGVEKRPGTQFRHCS